MTSTDLGNQCFKTCSLIPMTRVKTLLLNSALLEIRIPAQLLIVHMQVQIWTKFGIHLQFLRNLLTFADSTYFLRNPLTVAESRTTSYTCLLRNAQQNKCADKIYVTGISMQNPLKFCLWNESTYIWEHILRHVTGI